MKKILLSAAFVIAALTGANAQQTISFEASEGYTLGDISGQNGWGATNLPANPNNPTFTITNTLFTDGSNSFYAEGTNLQYTSNNQTALLGIFSPDDIVIASDIFEISADLYFTTPTTEGNGSDVHFGAQSAGENLLTSRMVFSYDGSINVIDNPEGTIAYQVVGEYEYGTWYNVKIVYDFVSGSIEYFIDGTSIYLGNVWSNATTVDQLFFVFDNYESGFYVDNIIIAEDGASTGNFASSTFSVYPNPAKDVINVANSVDAIENVTITDMNGRVVKQVVLGVNEGQINISDLSQGVYILNATSNGKSVTEKIVKQ